MDAGLAAIIGAAVGALGGGGAQVWDRWRADHRAERDSQLALLDRALMVVSRQRNLVTDVFAGWLKGEDTSDLEKRWDAMIEEAWHLDDVIAVRFGEGSEVRDAFRSLLGTLDFLSGVCNQRGDFSDSSKPNIAQRVAFSSGLDDVDRRRAEFTQAVRRELGFRDPRPAPLRSNRGPHRGPWVW